MTTIKDVLVKTKQIKEYAKQFGFKTTIRIYQEDSNNSSPLILIVQETTTQKTLDLDSFLSSKLSELLNCQVDVIEYDKIKKLYQYDVDMKSLSIDDNEAMQALLAKDIMYASLTAEDKVYQDIILQQAEDYLKDHPIKSAGEEVQQSAQFQPLTSDRSKRTLAQETPTHETKRPRLEMNESATTVSIIIPIPQGVVFDQDHQARQAIADKLAEQFYKSINEEPLILGKDLKT